MMNFVCLKKGCKKRIKLPYNGEDGIEEICNNCKEIYKVAPPSRKRVNSLWFLLSLLIVGGAAISYTIYNQNMAPLEQVESKIISTIKGEYLCSSCVAKECIAKKIKIYNLSPPNIDGKFTFNWDTPSLGKKGKKLDGKFYSHNNTDLALLLFSNKDTFGVFEFFIDENDKIQKLTHQNIEQCTFEKQ